jgi:hypothetical protein
MNNRLRAAIFVLSARPEDAGLLCFRIARSRDLLDASYKTYRHAASFLKCFTKTLLILPIISNVYAASTLEKVSSVYRLKGPLEAPDSLRTETSPKGSAACGGKSVADIILGFSEPAKAQPWIDIERFSSQGPCEIKAYPTPQGFELRLSYVASAGSEFQTLSYGTQSNWIVDHWLVVREKRGGKTAQVIREKRVKGKASPNDGLSPLVNFSDKVLDIYQDQEAWNKILGQMGQVVSFESPELDRFRVALSERDVSFGKLPRSQRPLVPPLLPLPMLDAELSFSEQAFEIARFEKGDLPKGNAENVAAALEGLNYLRQLVADKEWLKARESMAVLEKGNVKKLIPVDSARWWAIKGLVYRRLSEALSNRDLHREGLDIWRTGLRRVAGRGGNDQAGADYMMLESLRDLFADGQFYAAAAMLAWAQRFRWSPPTEERLAFLRAESHYRLGLMRESHELFAEYVSSRKDVPLSAAFDRRLLPLAAFRLGDAQLRQNLYAEAIADYSEAFAMIPTQQKMSFEGAWYPSEINRYPQVFFHRAEARLRMGNVGGALSDLRAFVSFAADHPNLGLILYRIGDLMELVGAPKEKIEGAWRECVFRTGENLGGKLCKARQSRRAMNAKNRGEWPRLVADIEDVLLSKNIAVFEPSFASDLKIYVRVLLADGFLKAGDPFQSYEQFDRTRGFEGSPDLLAWLQEYRLSALAGYLDSKVDAQKASEVMSALQKAKALPGLDESRPELLWPLARAYAALGLWKQSHEYAERGLAANASTRPYKDRPYLPSVVDWSKLRSKVELKLLLSSDIEANVVEKHLKEVNGDGKDPEILRLWKDFYKLSRNTVKEAETLAALKKIAALSSEEWTRYFEVLLLNKDERRLRSELESYVGPWMASAPGRAGSDAPAAETFFMLFEARERQGDLTGAATVLSYLLSKSELGAALSKEQILFRQGQLRRKEGKLQEARQSFEAAKALSADSMWGRLSVSELQSL